MVPLGDFISTLIPKIRASNLSLCTSINTVLKEEIMNKIIGLSAALLLCVGSQAIASSKTDKEACAKVKADIREVQARMRSGYTAAQGIRYDERLRKLHDKRRRICR